MPASGKLRSTAMLGRPALSRRTVGTLVVGAGVLGVFSWLGAGHSPTAESSARRTEATPAAADAAADPPGVIGLSALLPQLTDLSRLAELPEPAYVTRLASSYDRRSRRPGEDDWFANDDWATSENKHYVRKETHDEREEFVLLDATGPGVLTRIWTATPTGTLRIYLDGEARPALAESMTVLLSGAGPFPEPFSYVAARGYNLYFPIAYRKSIRVTVDTLLAKTSDGAPLPKFYYQLTYRTYGAEVAERVRTFTQAELSRAQPTLAAVARDLEVPKRLDAHTEGFERKTFTESGDVLSVHVSRPGGGVLRDLWFLVPDPSFPRLERTALVFLFDQRPPVRVPFSAFFGTAEAPLESLPFSVSQDGSFTCRFPMPFADSATVRVENAAGITGSLLVEPKPFGPKSLYFGISHRGEAQRSTRPFADLELARISGQGVYVGTAFEIENPSTRWWGEGDEKMFVDDEAFPSLFGTGTEDYFGYAWSTPAIFQRPFHAQPRADGPGFSGHVTNLRFHVLDAIPFTRSFKFDLELWHWEETRVAWSSVAYSYAR